MTKMKTSPDLRIAATACLIALCTISLSAQGPGRGQGREGGQGGPGRGPGFQMTEEDVERRVENMAGTLELTEEQHQEILLYEKETYTKMQVEREKNMGDREAMRASMMKIREERDSYYEEVLNADQMVKYRETQEQRRNQRRERFEQGGSENQGDRPARGRGRSQSGG